MDWFLTLSLSFVLQHSVGWLRPADTLNSPNAAKEQWAFKKQKKTIIILFKLFPLLSLKSCMWPWWAKFYSFVIDLPSGKESSKTGGKKVQWWFSSFHMGKNCRHLAKLRGGGESLEHWLELHSLLEKRIFPEALLTKKRNRSQKIGPLPLWFRTRRIQAAATSRCCRMALGRWMTTGYWGSCGSAGPPYCTTWPGGSPNPASSCGQNKEGRETCVRDK